MAGSVQLPPIGRKLSRRLWDAAQIYADDAVLLDLLIEAATALRKYELKDAQNARSS